ncbi:hypothetical protein COEREDRAFT_11058 [Coemansia reversa NRRL 1564]|uniref:C2 domain-containing protein n=1 Tax=Coemansia reversa (strain ATCC 12441 / NRRL 1564) TaxID=763665 RepID=A0A2G5B444_COERN|nr:hypothetical protein COEREDRAFT_11058 [Coemansia reversa NRRL 1564]|eukprot:PIA13778.1 hypothetical protein COEREDRAFT_11058 [Coemansia reversa NRRL 1564]
MPPRPMPHATPATPAAGEEDNMRSNGSSTPFSVPADIQQSATSNGFSSQQSIATDTAVPNSAEPPTYASLLLNEGRVDDSFIDWQFTTADASADRIDTSALPANVANGGNSMHTSAAPALSAELCNNDAAMYAMSAPSANTYEDDKGPTAGYPLSAPVANTQDSDFNKKQTAPAQYAEDRDPSNGHNATRPANESEQVTYQYALRYAILLDADSAQLAARSRGVGKQGVQKVSSVRLAGTDDGKFTVKTIGKASGTPNHNNRTPTLVMRDRNTLTSEAASSRPRSRLRSKSWKNSILEFGDSAARKIKAEIGSNSKLKTLAKGKATGNGSDFLTPARPGALTLTIIKAIVQQLKTATAAPSLHPLTKACYIEVYNYLRVKEHGETLGEHGSIDDILSLFSDLSRSICSQHGITNAGDVDRTVDSQMSRFVKLLRAVLQSKAHTSREAGLALIKLDDYPDASVVGSSVDANANIPSPRSSSHEASGSLMPVEDSEQSNKLITTWLKKAFNVPDSDHREFLAELRHDVNQETAVQDLRTCLLVLKKDLSFAGRPDNFRTFQTYRVWKDREITLLEQLIHTYSMRQGYLSGENICVGRIKLEASAVEAMGEEEIAEAFEYIPTNAASHYLALVQRAVAYDIVNNVQSNTSDTIIPLSNIAKELLNQLAIAWRISAPYRETCYLDVINNYYESGDLPIAYLFDAFGKIERIVHLINPQEWHTAQFKYLLDTQSRIEYRTLGVVQDIIEELDHQKPEKSADLKRLLRNLIINDVTCPVLVNKPMPNVEGRRREIMDILEPSIVYRCDCLTRQCFTDETSLSSSLDGYAQLAVLVCCDYERCCKLFSDPLCEDGDRRFDISGIVAEVETEYFYTNMSRHLVQFGYNVEDTDIEVTLELCKSISKIEEIHAQYSTSVLEGVDNRRLFRATILAWLANIDREKGKWAENALKQDSAPRELDIGKHSTSVIDLVSCFSQQVTSVQRLQWPDIETKAWFLTEFMKFTDVCFEVYAAVMMKQFLSCLNLPQEDGEPKSPMWNSMWNSRKYKEQSLTLSASTQAALSMLDESHPMQVTAEACIKINNLMVAQEKLYELHNDLGIRETVDALGGENRPSITDTSSDKFLLSFKVVRAEGIELFKKKYDASTDKGTRPYVKLAVTRQIESEVAKRHTFARTRPAIAGATNPRWNESFDWQVESRNEFLAPLEARICTRDGPKHLGFREKTRARAFFALPAQLTTGTDSSVDLVLDLEPSGHLLLQVTIDGERDDVEFYSGRMFRALGRTLSDMQQRIVEQVTVGIREYLRQILVSQPIRYRTSRIINPSHVGIDRGIERSIQFLKSGGHQAPATIRVTQESCCEALIPLIDYLEDNLHTLFVHLYEDAANGAIAKVWYEVLVSIEDILLPPLRGSSKGSAKPLTETDLHNVFDCLDFLKWYFEGGADKDGISSDVLESRKYLDLLQVRAMYFMMTKELIDEYMMSMRQSTAHSAEPSHLLDGPPESIGQPVLHTTDDIDNVPSDQRNSLSLLPPPLPKRPSTQSSERRSSQRFSGYGDSMNNSSSESLQLSSAQDVRAAIVSTTQNKSTLSRNRSVWAHKDAETLSRFKRNHRMVTDKGDLILRLLRLRFDKEAPKFVQTQLDLRTQQMHYEMRRAAKRH